VDKQSKEVMNIAIFGLGYVGAVSCGCLAALGHRVIGVDTNKSKVERINAGAPPVAEPELGRLIENAASTGLLTATQCTQTAVESSELCLLCVGTPSTKSGGVNSVYLEEVVCQIGEVLREMSKDFYVVANRSTAFVTIHRKLAELLESTSGKVLGESVGYVCHPEFLREGVAVADFFDPPKIVFGLSDKRSAEMCDELYPGINARVFRVSQDTAAMVKYADNCFHAVKVTFANEIGQMCREHCVDSREVMDVFCSDTKLNISPRYLRPGAPFGGSCLPKDLRGLLDSARASAVQLPMLNGALESNRLQIEAIVKRILDKGKPRVGIVGLAFKEATDDVRESPMVAIVEALCGKGCSVRIFDRLLATENLIGSNKKFALSSIPHLERLLTTNLQELFTDGQVVVISHRLEKAAWSSIVCPKNVIVLDLVGIDNLKELKHYEGLYW
jgi:GDP-mannose 6-dehydrogenase